MGAEFQDTAGPISRKMADSPSTPLLGSHIELTWRRYMISPAIALALNVVSDTLLAFNKPFGHDRCGLTFAANVARFVKVRRGG